MGEQSGIWKSTDELHYENVVVRVKTDSTLEILILDGQSTIDTNKNSVTSGLYYEQCDISFDPQTKVVDINNIKGVVEIYRNWESHYVLIDEINPQIFSEHKKVLLKSGWPWNRKETEYYAFDACDLVFRRLSKNATKRLVMTSDKITIKVK